MKIITVSMQKGGVGKSTMVRNLAVYSALNGLRILIIDMDSQETIANWVERRGETEPNLDAVFSTGRSLNKFLLGAGNGGYDLVLVDTPPAQSPEAALAMEAADLIIVPCVPNIEAFEQLDKNITVAGRAGVPIVACLSMSMPNNESERMGAMMAFEAKGIEPIPFAICRRKAHGDASSLGLTALETEPDGKAASEIKMVASWILERLGLTNEKR